MLETASGELSTVFVNAALLALWPVLPILVLAYTKQSMLAKRIRPEFSLRKFESFELDRAAILHRQVCHNLMELRDRGERTDRSWRALFWRQTKITEQRADEIEYLEAYAQFLQAAIMRLRRRPLLRLKSWLRIQSSRFALGRALGTHIVGCALIATIAFHVFQQLVVLDEFAPMVTNSAMWFPFDHRLFYANAVAAAFTALAAPMFYFARWLKLRRQYHFEFCLFKSLVRAEPDAAAEQPQAEETVQDQLRQPEPSELCEDPHWFKTLGLSESATIDEVRKAYRDLIKQNHPDRVHHLSPALRKLAESEAKKVNAAYRQALRSRTSPSVVPEPVSN